MVSAERVRPCAYRLSFHLQYRAQACHYRALEKPFQPQSKRSLLVIVFCRMRYSRYPAEPYRANPTCQALSAGRKRRFQRWAGSYRPNGLGPISASRISFSFKVQSMDDWETSGVSGVGCIRLGAWLDLGISAHWQFPAQIGFLCALG